MATGPLSSFTLGLRPSRGPVIGRPLETAALEEAIEAVPAGGLRAVTLEGEPGIGKTHLLEAIAEMAVELKGISEPVDVVIVDWR